MGHTGAITARQVSNHTPVSVNLWVGKTLDGRTRDFRSSTYHSRKIDPVLGGDGRTWLAQVAPSSHGRWTAFFLTFHYASPSPGMKDWKTSTEVSVVPVTRPFPPSETRANYLFR